MSETLTSKGQLLIGGEWQPSEGGKEFETRDPATSEVLATLASATEQDVDRAVEAARQAFFAGEWTGMAPAARARVLWRVGELIDEHAEELAQLETRDQGQPLPISRQVSVAGATEHFRYYAGWVTKIEGETLPVSFPDVFNYALREPVGVCGLITPWNFPLLIDAWKLAPALACGNTAVLKPAEQTPLTALKLGELMALSLVIVLYAAIWLRIVKKLPLFKAVPLEKELETIRQRAEAVNEGLQDRSVGTGSEQRR